MKVFSYFLTFVSAAALSPFLQGEEGSEPETDAAPAQQQQQAAAETAAKEAAPAETAAPVTPLPPVTDPVTAPADAPESVPAAKPAPEAKAGEGDEKTAEPKLTEEQKKQLEIRLLTARKAKIDAELALGKARLAEKLTARSIERNRLENENMLRKARNEAKLAEIEIQKKKLDAVAARDKVREELAMLERNNRLREAELDIKIARTKQDLTLTRRNRELARVKVTETLRGIASTDVPAYRTDPLENGRLYISDRRVECNGLVTDGLAATIVERIALLNNQNSEYPIFLVIDSSPGGSVSAGYQILKAMESSKAPVYVVVKNYAASMAAIITTWAERSFCYSGTIILQHQPSTGFKGNLTQLGENLEHVTLWTRRITDKIATKMGMTYQEYVAQMYKHNSRGDWTEFGDGAKQWKWVTDVVDTMEESGIVRKNTQNAVAAQQQQQQQPGIDPAPDPRKSGEYLIDERGKPYVLLPTLAPGDVWMIYDPDNFYRIAG